MSVSLSARLTTAARVVARKERAFPAVPARVSFHAHRTELCRFWLLRPAIRLCSVSRSALLSSSSLLCLSLCSALLLVSALLCTPRLCSALLLVSQLFSVSFVALDLNIWRSRS